MKTLRGRRSHTGRLWSPRLGVLYLWPGWALSQTAHARKTLRVTFLCAHRVKSSRRMWLRFLWNLIRSKCICCSSKPWTLKGTLLFLTCSFKRVYTVCTVPKCLPKTKPLYKLKQMSCICLFCSDYMITILSSHFWLSRDVFSLNCFCFNHVWPVTIEEYSLNILLLDLYHNLFFLLFLCLMF